ncbi:hypothetical protein CWS01_11270 [Niallia nealsonii]|uniref:Carbohydrate kinase PfkB domain-containing protein n=1 Tax=Niallia nealsonii TaxID=115979 RepID=A0A2N0Z229_9BACI|nr:hypothetical protein CWS01_11270 [Niallia nealsonii]
MILKKQGIITIGDAFIDFFSTTSENDTFEKKLGGATVNVAVHISRFQIPSYYLTKLGTKEDSLFVRGEIEKEGVRLKYSVMDCNKELSAVHVHTGINGERQFHSYSNNTPDLVLKEQDITLDAFHNKKIFYFGSGTLFHPEAKKTTEKALNISKKMNLLVSFDANIRLQRWSSEKECRNVIKRLFHTIDILKLSEEEVLFLFEVDTLEEGLKRLAEYRIPVVFITMGEKGAYGLLPNSLVHKKGEAIVAIDTNGAGDAFMAAILYCIHEEGMPTTAETLSECLISGNILGGKVAEHVGSLPLLKDYRQIISSNMK